MKSYTRVWLQFTEVIQAELRSYYKKQSRVKSRHPYRFGCHQGQGQVAEPCRNSQTEIQEIEYILGRLCVFKGGVAGKGPVGSLKLVRGQDKSKKRARIDSQNSKSDVVPVFVARSEKKKKPPEHHTSIQTYRLFGRPSLNV